MNDLIRQAQMMQKKMASMQEELNKKEVEATSGGGMVRVKVNGAKEVLEIGIDPSVVDSEEVDMLQDLIVAATNEALKKAGDMVQSEMSEITGGMNIPGMF
jgi:hypothetical protein